MMYNNPEFVIETEGAQSEWKKQTSGIRQGCPMFPYLFLIAMTTIFDDIKSDHILKNKLINHRTKGATFDEMLYEDDTILSSDDLHTLQEYLHAIEKVSEKY